MRSLDRVYHCPESDVLPLDRSKRDGQRRAMIKNLLMGGTEPLATKSMQDTVSVISHYEAEIVEKLSLEAGTEHHDFVFSAGGFQIGCDRLVISRDCRAAALFWFRLGKPKPETYNPATLEARALAAMLFAEFPTLGICHAVVIQPLLPNHVAMAEITPDTASEILPMIKEAQKKRVGKAAGYWCGTCFLTEICSEYKTMKGKP